MLGNSLRCALVADLPYSETGNQQSYQQFLLKTFRMTGLWRNSIRAVHFEVPAFFRAKNQFRARPGHSHRYVAKTDRVKILGNDGYRPTGRTVLACGPLSPSSSVKVTSAPISKRSKP